MDFLAIRVYQYLLYVKLGNIHLVFFMHIFGSGLGMNSEKMVVLVQVTHYIMLDFFCLMFMLCAQNII